MKNYSINVSILNIEKNPTTIQNILMLCNKILSKLPAPYTITDSQIKTAYRTFYDNLLELYNKNDMYQIDCMLEHPRKKNIVQQLLYTILEYDPDSDAFLSDFASLLYKIATIYPVKHFKAQITTAMFLDEFLKKNKKYISYTFDWKPIYKIIKYYTRNEESIFISGYQPFSTKFEKIYLPSQQIFGFNTFDQFIPHFLPDEIEIKSNGLTVKTNTTEQILKKFIPEISINAFSMSEYLKYFLQFMPNFKGRYKEYIEYLIIIQNDQTLCTKSHSPLFLINKIIKTNIEDDFSFVIPLISNRILVEDTNDIIAKILVSLFISPPTRKKIIDLLENLFISFKKKYHPTDTIKFFDSFAFIIADSLQNAIKRIKKNDKKAKYYKMDKKLGPSQEDIHKILSIVCEISIMNIQNIGNFDIAKKLVYLDPILIDRFFEIELQCISMTDAINVASNGWTIFAKLASFIDKSDTIRDNFVKLFQIGMDSFFNEELRSKISTFLFNCLQKVPFNNQKTLKGLEKTDFNYLANLFFTNLFSVYRTFSELEEKTSDALIFGVRMDLPSKYNGLMNITSACSNILLSNCSKEILSDLLTLFTDLAYDKNLSPAVNAIKDIVSAYCINANEEQAQKVIKEFQSQLDLSSSNPLLFEYYSTINATLLIARNRSIESVNKTVDLILPYTKNDNQKIQKIAWHALYLCFSYFNFGNNAKVTFKPDKMNENSSEVGYFEDFEIEFLPVLDLSEKIFEVYSPIFEKLMQEKDQYEIYSIINEFGDDISAMIQNIYLFTEGSNDIVYNNEISNVPQLIKKSVPIKDKFMESMCRIIHDFSENQTLVTQILKMVKKSIISECNNNFYFSNTLDSFDTNKKKMNKEILQLYVNYIDCKRKAYLVTPLSNELKHFFDLTVDLLINNNKEIRSQCSQFLFDVSQLYGSYFYPIITSKIIEKRESIPIDVFVSSLSILPKNEFFIANDQLFCQTVLYILKNFHKDSKEKKFLDDLNEFIQNAIDMPLSVPFESNKDYENLLNEIEANYLINAKTNRSLKNVILQLIKLSLKHIKNVNDNILKFIIDCITHFDQTISPNAVPILVIALERKANFTKERIEIKKFPTFETMPNILDKVVVKLPTNGFYFPSRKSSSENAENDEYVDNFWSSPSADYSIDIEATNSIDVNMEGLTEDEDIIKVFEAFKSIEIEWKMTEEERILFDSEYMADASSGYFMFADHYTHKNYKFSDNKMLLKEIPNLFASAINSNNSYNEKIIFSNVDYLSVWKQYALYIGPFCIKKLAKISRKYLSKYFYSSPEITTKVLNDMIQGFMYGSVYWTIEDRITFYKLVVLPILCVFASSHTSSAVLQNIMKSLCIEITPFSFSPIIKVILELCQINPQNSLEFAKCIPALMVVRPLFMLHSIDQIKTQFIDKTDKKNKKEIILLSYILMTSLYCLSYICKGLPLYSDEVESKKIEFASILDKLLQIENDKDFLTSFLIYTFKNFAYNSHNCQLLTAPIFIKNFNNIFKLLKDIKISNEDLFFMNFKTFLNNNIFFSNSSIKSDFLPSFISELMNSPLQAQSILLDSINDMIEKNIFTFDMDEYAKYEDMFLKYGRVAKAANLGNEMRLKIAKNLGIFEIRKCTLKKWDYSSEKVDDSEVDDVILKAAAIVLNSYLFDKVDDNLKNALETLENLCINKKKGSANYEFFISVLNIFIIRHSGHVINDAEELLIQCRSKTSPSYVS